METLVKTAPNLFSGYRLNSSMLLFGEGYKILPDSVASFQGNSFVLQGGQSQRHDGQINYFDSSKWILLTSFVVDEQGCISFKI